MKGPSWLSCLRSFDLVNGMSPDYMHCALLGVTKLLLKLWLDKTRNRHTIHDLHTDIPVIDERMKQISVPSEIRRKPRGVADVKHWKGTCIHACESLVSVDIILIS